MTGAAPAEARVALALSAERLRPYLQASRGNLTEAVRLYEWNIAVSGALYEALSILEVVLRNALSEQLAALHGALAGHWYDDPHGILSDQAHADVAAARRRMSRLRRTETPGRLIAELNFGFWKFLLAKRYEATLWTSHLRHAFPRLRPQNRGVAYRALDELHTVRNRIAHHEPIHGRDLIADTLTIYQVLDWIEADVRAWALSISRLRSVISARPQ
ncbi:hypothetical protein [Salana multivorans]